jgi:hypothetical protein
MVRMTMLVWMLAAIWAGGLAFPAAGAAEEAAAPVAPVPERVYAAKFDEVWDAALTFLKTRMVPIPVASAEKDAEKPKDHPKGVITTLPLRHFKIASATFPRGRIPRHLHAHVHRPAQGSAAGHASRAGRSPAAGRQAG